MGDGGEEESPTWNGGIKLPTGFRFIPMDHELIFYLHNRIRSGPTLVDIKDVDLYKTDPKTLTEMYPPLGEKEWYFFTSRNRKYPNGSRPDRAVGGGYWKATVAEKEVYLDDKVVGFKKTLVFHRGKHQKSIKTNWIMHEFTVDKSPRKSKRDANDHMKLEDWVLCRIHERSSKVKGNQQEDHHHRVEYHETTPNYSQAEEAIDDAQIQIPADRNNQEYDPAAAFVEPEYIFTDEEINEILKNIPDDLPPSLDGALNNAGLFQTDGNLDGAMDSSLIINHVDESSPNPQVEAVVNTEVIQIPEEDRAALVMPETSDGELGLSPIIDLTDFLPSFSREDILDLPDPVFSDTGDVFLNTCWPAMEEIGVFQQGAFDHASTFVQGANFGAFADHSIDSLNCGMANNDPDYNQVMPVGKRMCSSMYRSCCFV